MAKKLSARPHLDHLRRQAKTLLAEVARGSDDAARTFIEHLPAARGMTPAKVRGAGFRLADAQSAVARASGFGTWPALAHHVKDLRALEGEWQFARLEVDGAAMPPAGIAGSRVLIDGDRFRTESPGGNHDGVFTIDVEASPRRIDIEFVEGPEAGNRSLGIYDLRGDQLTICLAFPGVPRPAGFSTTPGSGHALERLRRTSARRPAGVTGGTRAAASQVPAKPSPAQDPRAFEVAMTPLLERLQGEWSCLELNQGGQPMPDEWLGFGSRRTTGNETTVTFGGQVQVHARMRFDESTAPVLVDYLYLAGSSAGNVGLGLIDWSGDEVRFVIAAPGQPRPADFAPGKHRTVSRWRRKC